MGGSLDRLESIVPRIVIERMKEKVAAGGGTLGALVRDIGTE